MIRLRVSVDSSGLRRRISERRRAISQLPEEAYRYFVAQTPVRSGNARRNTRLVGRTIRADYPYAGRLDEGWSNQAPRGMVKPTLEWIRRRFKDIMRRGKP